MKTSEMTTSELCHFAHKALNASAQFGDKYFVTKRRREYWVNVQGIRVPHGFPTLTQACAKVDAIINSLMDAWKVRDWTETLQKLLADRDTALARGIASGPHADWPRRVLHGEDLRTFNALAGGK